jgi:hypothetical protein
MGMDRVASIDYREIFRFGPIFTLHVAQSVEEKDSLGVPRAGASLTKAHLTRRY